MTRSLAEMAAELDALEQAWRALEWADGRTSAATVRLGSAGGVVGNLDGRTLPDGLASEGMARKESVGRVAPGMDGGIRQLGPHRIHKAGSAESILRHCLRQTGLTAAYRQGILTGEQALELLETVRQYAREWLRHEAEQLIRHHGRMDDGGRGNPVGRGANEHGIPLPRGSTSAIEDRGDSDQGPVALEWRDGDGGLSRSLTSAMRHHVGRFFRRAAQFVHESILAGAMALSGPGPLSDEELAGVDRVVADQVAYLGQFERDVHLHTPPEIAISTAPPDPEAMTALQFAARAEQYAGPVWGANINARRRTIIRSRRYTQERRMHARPMAQHDPCATCEGESAKGWMPIGTLAEIGDSECLGINCDCYFEYREGQVA